MPKFTTTNNPKIKPGTVKKVDLTRLSRGDPMILQPEIDAVKRLAIETVKTHMPTVDKVLRGEKSWSPAQVRLFGMMLNKAVPDMKQHHHTGEIDHLHKRADELTADELKAIAAQGLAELGSARGEPLPNPPPGLTLEGVAQDLTPED